eukprot:CCRYP_013277-RA/>CCRYP_013277-RA protein AED:0.19 eAED:0.16 QI:0/0/0/1/1/1/2/0/211
MNFCMPSNHFGEAAQPILSLNIACLDGIRDQQRWMACFGATPNVMADIWTRIDPESTMSAGVHPNLMMWMFYFLKLYNSEAVNGRSIGAIATNRHFGSGHGFFEATLYLEYPVISWDNRKSVDGTDMSVQHRFDPKYLYHKFNSNGLKYELGVCIQTGNIVWINGPFRTDFHDVDICRQSLIGALDEDKVVEADGGSMRASLPANSKGCKG